MLTPARYVPDLTVLGSPVTELSLGSIKPFVVGGVRASRSSNGAVRISPGSFGNLHNPLQVLQLPPRLGRGLLFVAKRTSSSVDVWRADRWDSPLEPVVRLPSNNGKIVAGFDRLYALSTRNSRYRSQSAVIPFHPTSCKWASLGPLPRPAAYANMVFDGPWRGAVLVDWLGPMVTSDGGASWHPVSVPGRVRRVTKRGSSFVFQTSGKTFTLDPDGTLSARPKLPSRANHSLVVPKNDSPFPERKNYAAEAVAHGVPVAPDNVLLVDGTDLLRISGRDGHLIRRVSDVVDDGYRSCDGAAVGTGVGFVCLGKDQHVSVLQVRGDDVRELLRLNAPPARKVTTSSFGALAFTGPCPGTPAPKQADAYCVLHRGGGLQQIVVSRNDRSRQVVPLRYGRVAIVAPPEHSASGVVVTVQGNRTSSAFLTVAKGVKAASKAIAQEILSARGTWLGGVYEKRPGVLGAWVQVGRSLHGIEVTLDGRVVVGVPQATLSGRLLVSGVYGFAWSHFGRGVETIDGGMTWKEVSAPPFFEVRGPSSSARKCGAAGCALGAWTRFGWGEKSDPFDEPPMPCQMTSPSFRWSRYLSLTCEATGTMSPPPVIEPKVHTRRPLRPRRPSRAYSRRPRVRAKRWPAFLSYRPPPLTRAHLGRSDGRTYGANRYRLYAQTPVGSNWMSGATWWFVADEPFSTKAPWSSIASALDPRFASLPSWRWRVSGIAWDHIRHGVLLSICSGVGCYVMTAGPGESGRLLRRADGRPWSRADSAVRFGDGWIVLTGRNYMTRSLFRVGSDGVGRLIGQFPRWARRADTDTQLIRTKDGTGLGLWLKNTQPGELSQWTILQLDPKTGQVIGSFSVPTVDKKGKLLIQACPKDPQGWEVDTRWYKGLEMHFGGHAITGVDVLLRLVVNHEGACVEGASMSRANLPKRVPGSKMRRQQSPTIPVVVWDRSARRKVGFRCYVPE